MKPKRLILNKVSKIVHKLPGMEFCNTDQLRKVGKFKLIHSIHEAPKARRCKHCFAR